MADNDQTQNRVPRSADFQRLKACTAKVVDDYSPSGSHLGWHQFSGDSQLHMGPLAETFSIESLGPENRPAGQREDIVAFVETDGKATNMFIQDGREETGRESRVFSSAHVEGIVNKDGNLTVGSPSANPNGKSDVNVTMADRAKTMAREIQVCTNSSSPPPIKKPIYGLKP